MDAERLGFLLDRYVDAAIEPAEKAELERMLLSSAEARTIFWEKARFHALLRQYGEQSWGRDEASAAPAKIVRFPLHRVAWLAAAACLVLGGVAAMAWRQMRTPEEPMTNGLAVLGQTVDAVWADGPARSTGSVLPPGWLHLKSGLAQVEFVSGARVILEGPAEFQLVAPLEGFCQSGRLSAEVPSQAAGFRVASPKAAVVDLGTEFGMDVRLDGTTDVHVFRGRVEVERAGEKLPLAEGGSVRVGADGAFADLGDFTPVFPNSEELESRAADGLRAQHAGWRLAARQMASLPGLVLFFDFESGTPWARTLPNVSEDAARGPDGSIVGCRWTEGRWPGKRALEFHAITDRVRLSAPGDFQSLTFAAWVRVDGLDRSFNSLLMCDAWDKSDVHWQISKDGQLILGVHGSTKHHDYRSVPMFPPERLSQWTHLAVVFDRTTGRVSHYLDGRQVADEAIAPENDVPLHLDHAELGNWNSNAKGDSRPIRNFNGRMDEVLVFNRGLTAPEVLTLCRAGQPRP